MSHQQADFDSWANLNQPSWGNGNWLAVARVQADVIARAALIAPAPNSKKQSRLHRHQFASI